MSIYDSLNPMQQEAVFCTEGPLLVLAGAGSGKTRVLTHRVAYLIEEKQVNPWNIMAITFTNKAAGEMRERVDQLVGFGAESIWVSTFHSSCVRILRRHVEALGYSTSFSIYDTDDQRTLMKQVFKSLDVDTKQFKDGNFWTVHSNLHLLQHPVKHSRLERSMVGRPVGYIECVERGMFCLLYTSPSFVFHSVSC